MPFKPPNRGDQAGRTAITRRAVLSAAMSATVAKADPASAVTVTYLDTAHRRVRISAGQKTLILDASDFDGLSSRPDRRPRFRIEQEPNRLGIRLLDGGLHPNAPLSWSLHIIGSGQSDDPLLPAAATATLRLDIEIAERRWPLVPAPGGKLLDFLAPAPGSAPRLQLDVSADDAARLCGRLFGERIGPTLLSGTTDPSGYTLSINWEGLEGNQVERLAAWRLDGNGRRGFTLWRNRLQLQSLSFGRRLHLHTAFRQDIAKLFPRADTQGAQPALLGHAAGLVQRRELVADDLPSNSATQPPQLRLLDPDAARLGLRTAVTERETVSAVWGKMELWFGPTGQPASEGPIRGEQGLVQRGLGLDPTASNRLRTRIMLQPPAEYWAMQTRHGRLIVSGPEAADQRWNPSRQPVVLEFEDRANNRLAPVSFRAELRLSNAGIPLAAESDGAGDEQSTSWSRLDFDGARCGFALGELPGQSDPTGFPCFVRLGWRSPGRFTAPPLRLSLESATLRAVRPRDLLALRWRFQGMVLEMDRGEARLVADHRMAPQRHPTVQADADLRPRIAVEFPPQHLAEMAYFRRLIRPPIPEVELPQDNELADLLRRIEGPSRTDRLLARRALQTKMWRHLGAPANIQMPPPPSLNCLTPTPAVTALSSTPAAEIFLRFVQAFEHEALCKNLDPEVAIYVGHYSPAPEASEVAATAARSGLNALERLGQLPDAPGPGAEEADFTGFQRFYCVHASPLFPAPFPGREQFRSFLASQPNKEDIARAVLDVLDRYDQHRDSQIEPFRLVTPARHAAPSRLVFRLDMTRPAREGRASGELPFSLGALTDWGAMDLAVVRRAEVLFERDDGQGARTRNKDLASVLAFQGLTATRFGPFGRVPVHWRQRLREVADSARRPPQPFETAIEVPARLMLSPAQDALWHTPRRLRIIQPASRTALWTANLLSDPDVPDLRAIWSPDFRPDYLFGDNSACEPLASTDPPWPPLPVSLPAAPGMANCVAPNDASRPPPFRMATDARDRHQLVAMSSLHGLVVRARRRGDHLAGDDQAEQPSAFTVAGLVTADGAVDDRPAIHVPRTITAARLALSALGATADLDAAFEPPVAAKVQGEAPGAPVFAFSVEHFTQRSVLGRDVEVEVQYRGYLFPIGVRCVLVKRTERMFRRRPCCGGSCGAACSLGLAPTAFLVQRKFLRIVEPDKKFPAPFQSFDGRQCALTALRMLETVSPDLVDPESDDPKLPEGLPAEQDLHIGANGRIRIKDGTGLVFWPRTARRDGAELEFPTRVVTLNGRATDTAASFIFVDNVAASNAGMLERLANYYNGTNLPPGTNIQPRLRSLALKEARLCYARETEDDQNSHVTQSWTLGAEGRPSPWLPTFTADGTPNNHNFDFSAQLRGQNQPPFFPVVKEATILLDAVERFTTAPAEPVVVKWNPDYLREGFVTVGRGRTPNDAAKADVYLLLKQIRFMRMADGARAAGDRSGGAGQPDLPICGLSASQGPTGWAGGDSARLAAGSTPPSGPGGTALIGANFKPMTFFDPEAKLLGLFPLKDVLKELGIDVGGAPPRMVQTVDWGAGELGADAVRELRTRLLVPLRQSLRQLEAAYRERRPQGSVGELWDQLELGFSGTGQAWQELGASLDATILATESGNLVELGLLLARAYSASKRLVQCLKDIARNPAGLLTALVGQLNAILVGAILPEVQPLLDLQTQVEAFLKKLVDEAWTVLLTLPQAEPDLQSWIETRVKAALNGVLAEALPEAGPTMMTIKAFVEDPGGPIQGPSNADLAGEALATHLLGRLAIEAANEVDQTLAPRLRQWVRDAQENPTAVAGPLLLLAVIAIVLLRPRVEGQDVARQILALSQRMVGPALSEVQRRMWSGVKPVCDAALKSLKNVLVIFLPSVSAGGNAVASAMANAIGALRRLPANAPSDVHKAGEALADALAALSGTLADGLSRYEKARAAVMRALSAWPTSCAPPPAPVPILPWFELREMHAAAGAAFSAFQQVQTTLVPRGAAQGLLQALIREAEFSAQSAVKAAIVDAAAPLAQQLLSTAADITALGAELSDAATERFKALDEFAQQAGSEGQALRVAVQARKQAYEQAFDDLKQVAFNDLLRVTRTVTGRFEDWEKELRDKAERAALRLLLDIAGGLGRAESEVQGTLAPALRPLLKATGDAHGWAAEQRVKLTNLLGANEAFAPLLQALAIKRGAPPNDVDALPYDRDKLLRAAASNDDALVLDTFAYYGQLAHDGLLGLQLLGSQLPKIEELAGRAVILAATRLLDLDGLRRDLEAALREMVPAKVRLAYDMDLPLKQHEFPIGPGKISFLPDRDARLSLSSAIETDLLKAVIGLAGEAVSARFTGRVGAFQINLADFVTFDFGGMRFDSDGGTPRFAVDFRGVIPGNNLTYIQKLQSMLSPKEGNGPYVQALPGGRGVEAGYRLYLSAVNLGPITFLNVSLNAGLVLPFDSGEAIFRVSIGSSAAPFLICMPPYGGGGYLAIEGSAKGGKPVINALEMAFQFGFGGGFSFGPLTGSGFVMVGLFIRLDYTSANVGTRIAGFFVASGSASIACFGVSAVLLVRVEDQGGSAKGRGVFEFSFKVGFASINYRVPVAPVIPGASSRAAIAQAPSDDDDDHWDEVPNLHHENRTFGPGLNWQRYRGYFDEGMLQ